MVSVYRYDNGSRPLVGPFVGRGGEITAPAPAFTWSAAEGRIDSSGDFTAPSVSMPCQVTVASGNVSVTAAVKVTGGSPESSTRLGDSFIEPLFEAGLGSPGSGGTRQAHLDALSGAAPVAVAGPEGASPATWPPDLNGAFPAAYAECGTSHDRTVSAPSTTTTAWSTDDVALTAVETDWIAETLTCEYASATDWSYEETNVANFRIRTTGGQEPTSVTGSVTVTVTATPQTWTYTATVTATASGTLPGGRWSQTTTDRVTMTWSDSGGDNVSGSGGDNVSGSGQTQASYSCTQPYGGGTPDLPSNGTQTQTFQGGDSSSFDRASGSASVESWGNYATSYSGSGCSRSTGVPSIVNEHGSTADSCDFTNTYSEHSKGSGVFDRGESLFARARIEERRHATMVSVYGNEKKDKDSRPLLCPKLAAERGSAGAWRLLIGPSGSQSSQSLQPDAAFGI